MCRIDMSTPDSPLRIVVKTSRSRANAQRIVSAIAERQRQRDENKNPMGLFETMRRYAEPQRSGEWGRLFQSASA